MVRLLSFVISSFFLLGTAFADSSVVLDKRDDLRAGGIATRYWDCCKPSGAWPDKAPVKRAVLACKRDGVTRIANPLAKNACEAGGTAYGCSNHKPFVSKTNKKISYAFAARGSSVGESNFECACYALKFKELKGKTLVVQATNTGGDVSANNFDVQIPAGGVGIYSACEKQYNSPAGGWGARYGGVSSINDCEALPASIRSGCRWRFKWFADNPTISSVKRVRCPKVLTSKSGCKRKDDLHFPAAPH